jgi:hypothetical protein
MKIAILLEGATETAFLPTLRNFLMPRLVGRMPRLDPVPFHGRLPKGEKLRRQVTNLFRGQYPADAVIALTDIYTGTGDFRDAVDAKEKMREWVGDEARFHPHVALHDFEAWLLPYWGAIQDLAGSNRGAPANQPENVNHQRPPAHLLAEVFLAGKKRKKYVKPRDASRIMRDQDLGIAAGACPELKSFLNTILELSGGQLL